VDLTHGDTPMTGLKNSLVHVCLCLFWGGGRGAGGTWTKVSIVRYTLFFVRIIYQDILWAKIIWVELILKRPRSIFRCVRKITKKATISSVMSIRSSGCLQEATRLPLDGFSWNLIFEYVSKFCRKELSLIKIGQEQRTLYMKTHERFKSYLPHFFL